MKYDNIKKNIVNYYDLYCKKLVTGFYYKHHKVFREQGIELDDVKHEVIINLLYTIKNKNIKVKGGYIYNSSRWFLNNFLSKTLTRYRKNISFEHYTFKPELANDAEVTKTDYILKTVNINFTKILKSVCTKKEILAITEYFTKSKKSREISLLMNISQQRVADIIKSGLLKLNLYFNNLLKRSK